MLSSFFYSGVTMSLRTVLLGLRLGESIFTTQHDQSAAATASRAGVRVTTENFLALPIRIPHRQREIKALRICRVTRIK
jgi:hypothetical protein